VATGSTRSLALVGLVAGAGLMVLVAEIGFESLLIWAVAGAALYPFIRFPSGHEVVTFDRLWIGAMVGCLILRARPVSGRSRAARYFTVAFVWLAASFVIRAYLTPNEQASNLETSLDAVVLPLILFLVARREVVTVRRTERVALALGLAGAVLALIGIAERIFGFELASRVGGTQRIDINVDIVRISGPFSAPEPYALALLICLGATMYWLQRRRAYWLGSALVGIQLIAIALALFRTAWVAALIIVVASLGLRPRRYGRFFTVAGLVAALVVVAFGQLQQQNTAFKTRVENKSNAYVRLATYEQGWDLFKSDPLAGVGVNQYPLAVKGRVRMTVDGSPSEDYPHSSYMGSLAEQGLWGFLPLMAVTLGVPLMLRRYRRLSKGADQVLYATVVGVAIGYLLMSLTLTMLPYGPSNNFFALMLGMVAGRLDALESPERPDEDA
jgi:hypothetical protein